ncbi:MAG: DUF3786 domain-containing protein [Desulfobacterium sp.]|nr:DUF3786 domain-containing protein [Desulfobacterium sp.]
MEKSDVFRQTYENYLKKISEIDFERIAPIIGAKKGEGGVVISYLDREYTVGPGGVTDDRGKTAFFPVSVVLLKYVLMAPAARPIPNDQWMNFRDFPDAGPLVTYFGSNVIQVLERGFEGRVNILRQRCLAIGAKNSPFASSFDLSVTIPVLPNVTVILNFNDRDDEFPAAANLLFDRTVALCLDMESVAIVGVAIAEAILEERVRGQG